MAETHVHVAVTVDDRAFLRTLAGIKRAASTLDRRLSAKGLDAVPRGKPEDDRPYVWEGDDA
jgi:hypothetical protein